MKISLTGNKGVIAKFQGRLMRLPTVGARMVNEQLAEEALMLVADGFTHERAPSGRRWKAITYRNGMILDDTGALKRGWQNATRTVTVRGFRIANHDVPYVNVHQKGIRVAARRMVPEGPNLPPRWAKALTATAKETLDLYFRK